MKVIGYYGTEVLFSYRNILSNKITLIVVMVIAILYFTFKNVIFYALMTTNKFDLVNCILQSAN